ncbi:MAG: PDDEXK nuclease domain-containing protein [Bacteroidales bacterium]|nr:PDDEXK nuclease domain-containing protein [Bacteroidales bacterium]
MKQEESIISVTQEFVGDIRRIIENGRQQAYAAASAISLATYWNIGRRIVEEEQKGNSRAEYGSRLIAGLAESLRKEYGPSYNKRNLEHFRKFYLLFNDVKIVNEFVHNLTWTHIRRLLSVTDPTARLWYLSQASKDMWSTTTLDRNISSQYYERRLSEQRANPKAILPEAVAPYNDTDPMEYIKNPTIAEFMGFRRDSQFNESELEQALIDNLEQFILELGRGFAFVERQQHITTDTDDFFIDLVFYNFRMKRFVIFELKTHKLRHADVGQLDMYVRMYDDLFRGEDDNPTIGVLLCTDTDSTIAKYSVLNDSQQLFAAKYMTYMPTEEELRCEIERQKQFFLEHHKPFSGIGSK